MMNDVEQQRQHFESIAGKYLESRRNVNHLAVKEMMWRFFLQDKGLRGNLRVLEAMCGYAEGKQILESYTPCRIDYTGFDYSETLVNHVRQAYPDAKVFLQDATTYEPGDERYDLIILIGGLHHVYRHVDEVVRRLHRALAPGGRFINLEPTQNNALFRAIRERIYKENDLFDDKTERAFDLDELNGLFRRNGFTLEDQIYPGLLSYVLYYNPDAFPKLNVGDPRLARALARLDQCFFRNWVGRKFSFATLSMWRKA